MPKKELMYSLESELLVISSILADDSGFDDANSRLRVDDFYDLRYRTIFLAFQTMRNISPASVLDPYNTHIQLGKMILNNGKVATSIITLDDLSEMIYNVVGLSSIDHAINVVSELSIKRQLQLASDQIEKIGSSPQTNSEEALAQVDAIIQDIRSRPGSANIITIKSAIEDLEYRLRTDPSAIPIASGYPDIDAYIGGFRKSEVTIVAARTSVGKTAFAFSIARNAALRGKHVLFFSLEMSADELTTRYLAMASKFIKQSNIRKNELNPDEFRALKQAAEDAVSVRLYLDTTPGLSIGEIVSRCKLKNNDVQRAFPGEQVDLVIIDYLQLISDLDKDNKYLKRSNRITTRHERVAEISRQIKQAAKELNIPFIVTAQLNREAAALTKKSPDRANPQDDGIEPTLANLAESGAIEQDADIVLMMWKCEVKAKDSSTISVDSMTGESKSDPTYIQIKVEKNRHGRSNVKVKYLFNGANYSFTKTETNFE